MDDSDFATVMTDADAPEWRAEWVERMPA